MTLAQCLNDYVSIIANQFGSCDFDSYLLLGAARWLSK